MHGQTLDERALYMISNVALQEAMSTYSEQIQKKQQIELSKTYTVAEINYKYAQLNSEYDKIKSDLLNDSISRFASPSNVEEYKNVIANNLKIKAFDLDLIDYSTYIKGGANFDEYLNIDFESDFQDYLKFRGCKNLEDLKALNESGFKTVGELKNAVEKSLNIFDINIKSAGLKTNVIENNLKNIMSKATVKELSNYVKTSSNDFYISQVSAALNLFKGTIDDETILKDFQDVMEEYLKKMMKLSSTEEKGDVLMIELYKFRLKDKDKAPKKKEDEDENEEDEANENIEGVVDDDEIKNLETNIDTFLKGFMAKESYGAQTTANV